MSQINLDPSKEKLVIEITEEEPGAGQETPAEEPLGMLPVPYNRRRTFRRPVRETEFIDPNIYVTVRDGGLLASGDDIDWVWNSPPELVLTPVVSPPGYVRFQRANPDYTPSYNAYMTARSAADFFPILPDVYGEYGHANSGVGAWNEDKQAYLWTGGNRVQSIGGAAFRRFDTNDTPRFKVTKLPSFASPEEPLVITESFDLVLMPIPYYHSGEGYEKELVDFSTPGWTYLLSGYTTILRRNEVFNDAAFIAFYGDNMFKRTVLDGLPESPLRPVDQRNYWYDWFTLKPEASLYKVYCFISFFARWYISHTGGAPTDLIRNGNPMMFWSAASGIYPPEVYLVDAGFKPQVLLAMIEHAGETYYVWSRFDFPLFTVGQRVKVRV